MSAKFGFWRQSQRERIRFMMIISCMGLSNVMMLIIRISPINIITSRGGAGLLGSQEVTSGIFRHICSLLLLTFPLTIPPTFTLLPRSFPFWASPPSSICASNFLDLQRFEWFRVKQSFQFLFCFQISSLTLPSQMVLPVWSNSVSQILQCVNTLTYKLLLHHHCNSQQLM